MPVISELRSIQQLGHASEASSITLNPTATSMQWISMNESDSLHFLSNIVKPVPAVYATEVHLVTMSGRILVDVQGLDFGGTNWDVPPAWQSSNSVVLEPGVRLHWRFWMILSLCFVQTFMCFFGRFVRCWPETRSFPDAIQVRPPSLLRQCRGEKHRKAFWGTEFAAPRYANVGKKRILEVCLRKKIKRA